MTFKIDYPNILPDFITPRNFLFFIISKEYVDYSSSIKCFNELIDEETKCQFYKFLFQATKDPSLDIFQYIKESDNSLIKKINSLVIKRIETLLGSLNELLSYNDVINLVNSVLSSLHERADVIGPESKGRLCKYSVIGSFMRKFCLAFQALPMEKVVSFLAGFRQVAEAQGLVTPTRPTVTANAIELKKERLSEDQARWGLQQLERGLEDVLFSGENGLVNGQECRTRLTRIARQYPSLPEPPMLEARLTNDLQRLERICLQQFPDNGMGSSGVSGSAFGVSRDPPHARRRDHAGTGTASGPQEPISGSAGGPSITTAGGKHAVLLRNSEIRTQLGESSLHCVVALSQRGCQQEALEHYRDAVFNAKMSRRADLIAEVGSAGNALMPINENPTGMAYSRITDTNIDDRTALGQVRDSLLHSLHNDRHCLAELLRKYFSLQGPQRRALTPICLIYLSVIFRSFGFHGMANSYMLIAGCLESIKRTKSHQEVLVELISQLIGIYSSTGQFERAQILYDNIGGHGNGMYEHPAVRASMLRARIAHQLAHQDESGAQRSLDRLRLVSVGEWALLRVHTLFTLELNMQAAVRLGNHVVTLAEQRRHQVAHVVSKTGVSGEDEHRIFSASSTGQESRSTITRVSSHITKDHLSETRFVSDLPNIDDCVTQNWGSRDWALYECRARYLLASQLVNHLQFPTCREHLEAIRVLAAKFLFYQFRRLCDVLELALLAREIEVGRRTPIESPLATVGNIQGSENLARSRTVLSSCLSLGPRNHAFFINVLVGLFVSNASRSAAVSGNPCRRNPLVEQHMRDLADYYLAAGDSAGQAHCWSTVSRYSDAVGQHEQKRRADLELNLLLENKLASVPSLDFLSYVL